MTLVVVYIQRVVLGLGLLTMAACGEETVDARSLLKYDVMILDEVSLSTGERDVVAKIFVPDGDGPFPVVAFSHGTFSSKDMYDPVLSHWARAGNIVVAPNHVDANYGRIPDGEEDMHNIVLTRSADLSLVADSIDVLEKDYPVLAGKMDGSRMATAGHSLGTLSAMLATGLRERHPETGAISFHEDDRFSAIIMLSDPGKMALQPAHVWKGMTVPTFMVTSPDDIGLMGDGQIETRYEMEVLTGEGAPEDSKYLLTIDGLDHYFGGAIHRDVDKAPDLEALDIFKDESVLFLAAIFHENTGAEKALFAQVEGGFDSPRADLAID